MVRSQKGFTIIELVVVIVILGILAAVAFPKFNDLSGDARRHHPRHPDQPDRRCGDRGRGRQFGHHRHQWRHLAELPRDLHRAGRDQHGPYRGS